MLGVARTPGRCPPHSYAPRLSPPRTATNAAHRRHPETDSTCPAARAMAARARLQNQSNTHRPEPPEFGPDANRHGCERPTSPYPCPPVAEPVETPHRDVVTALTSDADPWAITPRDPAFVNTLTPDPAVGALPLSIDYRWNRPPLPAQNPGVRWPGPALDASAPNACRWRWRNAPGLPTCHLLGC